MNFTGFTVYGIWGNARDNYWAVTNAGSAIHWNGTAWSSPQTIASGVVLTGIWGSSAADVWAVGQNTLAHWDGSGNWNVMSRSDFAANVVSGTAQNRMFVGGLATMPSPQPPAVLSWDGAQFASTTLGNGQDCAATRGIWAGPGDVWGITAAQFSAGSCDATPTVVRFTNNAWSSLGKIPNASFGLSIWGTSDVDLYVPGQNSSGNATLYHYNGSNWSPAYSTTAATTFRAVWGTGQP
jgi:hypothetical protein